MKARARPSPARRKLRRKKVVVVGNCQAETVTKGLRHCILGDRFDPVYHFVALDRGQHEQGRKDLAECDLILVQGIADWDGYPLRQFIPQGTETITFPCLWFASLWPFDGNNGPTDREAAASSAAQPVFTYFDGLLGRLRKEIPDKEERFATYRSLNQPGLFNYRRMHDFEERRLQRLDREFQCDIGRYILDRFRHERLFHTTNHPNAMLYKLLMQLICDRLGLSLSFPYEQSLDQIDGIQVPVHPRVARSLGVDWVNDETQYVFGDRMVTWESYVRLYIEHYG